MAAWAVLFWVMCAFKSSQNYSSLTKVPPNIRVILAAPLHGCEVESVVCSLSPGSGKIKISKPTPPGWK